MGAAAAWRLLRRDRRGAVAVEFAIVAPVVLTLAMGVAEVGRFAMLTLKLQHAATTLADLATREETLSAATLDSLFAAVGHVVQPFDMAAGGRAIVSGVALNPQAAARVFWQRRGPGTLAAASLVGTNGGAATLPPDLVLRPGETVVAAEVVYAYESWLLGMVSSRTLRRAAYYRPRAGTLQQLG